MMATHNIHYMNIMKKCESCMANILLRPRKHMLMVLATSLIICSTNTVWISLNFSQKLKMDTFQLSEMT